MSFKSIAVLSMILLLLLSALSSAEDIITIEIHNKFQADVVGGIVETAHTRNLNTFFVSVDEEQKNLLERAGIEYTILIEDADMSSMHLIRSASCGEVETARELDFTHIDIGNNKALADLSRFIAKSLMDSHDYTVNPLQDLDIRITYLPETITNSFTEVTDFPTDLIVNQISLDSIYAFDTRLEAFQTRYIWTDSIDRARDWMVQKLLAWGYTDVSYPSFYYNGDYHYNVMAVKQGYAEPDKVIVIGGHYDSITYGQPTTPYTYAPGADDNASGTTTMLELARVMASVPYRKTIVFMAFSAEEVGLVGSYYAAQYFAQNNIDVEVMFNYDMVGYDPNNDYGLEISSGANTAYRDMEIATVNRVSAINPIAGNTAPGGSDHASFDDWGFNISNNIEANFNYPGWHTNLDLSTRMNFPYLTEVVKSAAASIAYVATAAHPTEIEHIADVGDGQSLQISWSDCMPSYQYTLKYGTSSGVYTNEIVIPSGLCSSTVSGLTTGQRYYFGIFGEISDGYPALYTVEGSEIPYVIPRAPSNVSASPDFHKIIVDWNDNIELDFAFYRIYRSMNGINYTLIENNYMSSYYEDNNVVGQINYRYKITAVDNDSYESDFSVEAGAYSATFDGGILIVDDMSQTNPMPNQTGQEAYFDSLMNGYPYGLERIELSTTNDRLTRNVAGQYSSIFWFDDDLSPRMLPPSVDTINWYLDFNTNMLISGYNVLTNWTTSPISTSHILYQEFGVASYQTNSNMDFAGAFGQNGFPSLSFDSSVLFPNMPNVQIINVRSGGTVIYTYDSYSNNGIYENQPCGVMYNTANGKRIFLTFPLYWMTTTSAQVLINYIRTLFNETSTPETNGDIDGSGYVNIADITFLVDYMFSNGTPPPNMAIADVNNDCSVGITDLTYLVNYFFFGGSAPQIGCAK